MNEQQRPAIVVHPRLEGSRRVTVHGELVGKARSLEDVEELLRRAGLGNPDVLDPNLVEWRGGGPDAWG